jgi:hypothetical protein
MFRNDKLSKLWIPKFSPKIAIPFIIEALNSEVILLNDAAEDSFNYFKVKLIVDVCS